MVSWRSEGDAAQSSSQPSFESGCGEECVRCRPTRRATTTERLEIYHRTVGRNRNSNWRYRHLKEGLVRCMLRGREDDLTASQEMIRQYLSAIQAVTPMPGGRGGGQMEVAKGRRDGGARAGRDGEVWHGTMQRTYIWPLLHHKCFAWWRA